MGTRPEIGIGAGRGMGAGRDTRTKRRTQIGCRSRGKGGEPLLVSASLKRVWRRFPSGEGETQGDKQPLLHIPRGAARLWGRHRGEDALSLGALQKSPLLYLLSPQPWLAGFFFSSCWILLSKSRTRPFHVSAPKLRNPLPSAKLGNRRAGSGFAGCSRAPRAPHPARRGWRGWKLTGTPWISSCFVGVMAPPPGDGRVVLPPSHHHSTIPLPSSRPWDAPHPLQQGGKRAERIPLPAAARGGWQNRAKMGILEGFPEFPHSGLE